MHLYHASTAKNGLGASRDLTDANAQSRNSTGRLVVVKVTVPGQDVTFEVFLVRVPELGGLGIQWARAMPSLVTSVTGAGSGATLTCWVRPVNFADSAGRSARCRQRSICP